MVSVPMPPDALFANARLYCKSQEARNTSTVFTQLRHVCKSLKLVAWPPEWSSCWRGKLYTSTAVNSFPEKGPGVEIIDLHQAKYHDPDFASLEPFSETVPLNYSRPTQKRSTRPDPLAEDTEFIISNCSVSLAGPPPCRCAGARLCHTRVLI